MGHIITRYVSKIFGKFFNPIQKLQYTRTKMVFLVRTDLNMGKGKIASQVAHAAIQLYKASLKNKNPYLNMWLTWGQPKIVLKVYKDCETTLNNIYKDALNNNLMTCKIYDSGKTQIESGSLTVVAIGPGRVVDIDKITSQFKLL